MVETQIQTRLIKRQSKFPGVCTGCNEKINSDETFYLEEGVNQHVHSLIARRFCADCYSKYGERILLKTQ